MNVNKYLLTSMFIIHMTLWMEITKKLCSE